MSDDDSQPPGKSLLPKQIGNARELTLMGVLLLIAYGMPDTIQKIADPLLRSLVMLLAIIVLGVGGVYWGRKSK